jgi:DNA mismatch repair protein MSH4
MNEMKDMSYILQNINEKSLLIIDELGRGTSNNDGSSIAWSISEKLLSYKAYTFFVTHYIQLTELSLLYPNVKNFHLLVSTQNNELEYSYNITEGTCTEDGYGIKLAKMIGFPKKIIEKSK